MQDKELNTQDRARLNISVPMEVDQKFRQEAKKREVSISEMLVKLMDERDYFEKKLVEKERLIENTTEIISKDIIASLSEIKKTNLVLKTISGSLSSIPQVTEEARRINETCTKSAQVISNFNTVVSEMNETFSATRQKMNDYHKVLSSNTVNAQAVDDTLINTRKLFENGWKITSKSLQEEKEKIVREFKKDMRLQMDEIIDYEKLKTSSIHDTFNKKIMIFVVIWMCVTTLLSSLYLYDAYVNAGKGSDKIKVFDDFKGGLCSKSNRTVPGVDYSRLCN